MTNPSWDDLRVVLAISRARTLVQAARVLGVTHGTVSRRLSALEKQCGERLFARSADGYAATALGDRLIAAALKMEAASVDLERDLSGRGEVGTGVVRLSTLTIFVRNLAPAFASFQRENAGVQLEISTGMATASLERNEAHVVIRGTDRPQETLVGRCVGRMAFAPYASRSLVEEMGGELSVLPWLDWASCFGKRRLAEFLATHAPDARKVAQLEVFDDMRAAVRAGMGAAAMPCLDGDLDPQLVRLGPNIEGFGVDIWLLTHPAMKATPRVRALMQHAGLALDALRPHLEGNGRAEVAAAS